MSEDIAKDLSVLTSVRIATYNVSLYGDAEGALLKELKSGDSQRAKNVAKVLQIVRPDVVLLNEFDRDEAGESARIFIAQYLKKAQGDEAPIDYPFFYVAGTNTGMPTGVDLNGDGTSNADINTQAYGDDAFGFGRFPGQYGMIVLSRYPIATQNIRTFQTLRWKNMPENLLPTDFYSKAATNIFRLSSKTHADVPVTIDGKTIHLLISHPTPPSFDGDEDRNGKRNNDEIRFWLDYITGKNADYILDDAGKAGALGNNSFVMLGDLNSDPHDAGSERSALTALLANERVNDTKPSSEGGVETASEDGQANNSHVGDPKYDSADFSDRNVGNLRVDYALPSSDLKVIESKVFWPIKADAHGKLVKVSDHRLVYIDIEK